MGKTTWENVMALKCADKRHKGMANNLTEDEIETIVATMDFFGAERHELYQTIWDLQTARYRVFDWLAMCIQGRIANEPARKVLSHAFLTANGDIDKFIDNLRVHDYDIEREWEDITL